jgi:hypothetical protein
MDQVPLPNNLNTPAPVEQKHRHHLYWILFGITVLAIGALSIIAIKNFGTEEELLVLQEPVVNDVKSEAKDWETYKSEEYGFQVSYPGGWNYKNYSQGVYFFPADINIKDASSGLISINAYVIDQTIEQFINNSESGYDYYKKAEDVEIAGIIGKKQVNPPAPIPSERIVFKKDKTIYTISVVLDKSLEEKYSLDQKKEIFNRIVSTFKFTETADTAGWKTYKNKEYGFEFKYPNDWQSITPLPHAKFGEIAFFRSTKTIESLERDASFSPGYTYDLVVYRWKSLGDLFGGGTKYSSLEAVFNDKNAQIDFRKDAELLVNGVKVYKVTIGGNGVNRGAMVEHDAIYRLSFELEHDDSTANAIISTIKFTK